ncbi:MAG: aminotransferase class I/II-fold pyridoxal phosphate-dependent enzyme [Candidatus Coatesbacteria bacterium]|nr:aminotransferase class I/II-fold pyridoxal phosphate-dependent enzyme [Candidatus Coatesbacteria bacterium]
MVKQKVNPLFVKSEQFTRVREARKAGTYPYFRPISSGVCDEVTMEGQQVLMLGSNSYLGLNHHPRVIEAAKRALDTYGTSCAGSRFLNGTLDIHLELEEELAKLVNKPKALVFTTGFLTNLGVISSLVGRGEYIILDKLNHASIYEGSRLSYGKLIRYRHMDMKHLEERLFWLPPNKGKLIVVDGIFSMEGHIAPLARVVELAAKYNAAVMVDEAHAIGVMGPRGEGTAVHFGLEEKVDLIMGTFSKSLGSVGGFIAGEEIVLDYIQHISRSMIFSASLPAPNAAAALEAVRVMIEEPEHLDRLWHNTRKMKGGLDDLGFDTYGSETPVIPVMVGADDTAWEMTIKLQERGVFINPVISPAVPPGGALIRISLTAAHSDEQIERALETMALTGRELGIIE